MRKTAYIITQFSSVSIKKCKTLPFFLFIYNYRVLIGGNAVKIY